MVYDRIGTLLSYPLSSEASFRHGLLVLTNKATNPAAVKTDILRDDYIAKYGTISRDRALLEVQRFWFDERNDVSITLNQYLIDLARTLLNVEQSGGQVVLYCTDNYALETRQQLLWNVDVSLLIAAYAMSIDCADNVLKCPAPLIAIPARLPSDVANILVDQHVHLGAAHPFESIWTIAMSSKFLRTTPQHIDRCGDYPVLRATNEWPNFRYWLTQVALIHRLLALHLQNIVHGSLREFIRAQSDGLDDSSTSLVRWAARFIRFAGTSSQPFPSPSDSYSDLQVLLDKDIQIVEALEENDVSTIFGPEDCCERQFLYDCLQWMKNNPADDDFPKLFWIMMKIKNTLFQRIVHGGRTSGLGHFSLTYNQADPFTDMIPQSLYSALKNLESWGRLDKIEMRVAPGDGTCRGAKSLKNKILNSLKGYNLYLQENSDPSLVGLTVHYVKNPGEEGRLNCSDTMDDSPFLFSDYIKKVFRQHREVVTLCAQSQSLTHFFRGIDIANQETQIPNWIFAPLYRDIDRLNKGMIGRNKPIGKTAHLGEDYSHPLNGLRFIDEGLRNFALGRNDRIGHALVLGILPSAWLDSVADPVPEKNAKQVFITRRGLLDDLAWAYFFLGEVRSEDSSVQNNDNLYDQIGRWQDKLKSFFDEIARNIPYCLEHACSTLEITDWGQAYLERFHILDIADGSLRLGGGLIGELPSISQKAAEAVNTAYLRCEKWQKFLQKSHVFRMESWYCDMCELIQQLQLHRIGTEGVTIESCPTSNLCVSGVKVNDCERLPPFVFQPLESGARVRLTINSDDPLTFCTCLQNEIAYLGVRAEDNTKFNEWVKARMVTANDTTFVDDSIDIVRVQRICEELEMA